MVGEFCSWYIGWLMKLTILTYVTIFYDSKSKIVMSDSLIV